MKFEDFLEKLVGTSEELRGRELRTIHDAVDLTLVEKLEDVLRAVEKPTTGQICSSVAYLLAECLANSIPDKGRDRLVCDLATRYGEYVHNIAHGAYETYNLTSEKKH